MSTQDFIFGANKAFYFANNYEFDQFSITGYDGEKKDVWLPKFFKAFDDWVIPHLAGKWENLSGSRLTMFFDFFALLDGQNRYRVLEWIDNNYPLSDGYGLKHPADED